MRWRFFTLSSLAWLAVEGCSGSDGNRSADATTGACATCQAGAKTKDQYDILLSTNSAGVAGKNVGTGLPTLCAVQNPSCDPDDASSCRNAVPTLGQGGSTSSSVGSAAGVTVQLPSDLAIAAAGRADAVASGGAFAVAGDVGIPAGMAGVSGANAAAGSVAVAMACRVQRDNIVARATCEPAGSGKLGAPCVSRANCAAGYACVEESGTAQCRPYCCRGANSCSTGTYCDLRPTKELVTTNERLMVSVCMPGVDCKFDDPYPCPADRTCSCPVGKICSLVRSDGTTACLAPGTGREGEPCPCASGHVCSDAVNSCFKVCSLTSNDSGCQNGLCQASASMPEGWGICVSSNSLL